MSMVDDYKNYLREEEIYFDEKRFDDDDTLISVDVPLGEFDKSIKICLFFDADEYHVDIKIFGYLQAKSKKKMGSVYRHLNELNERYRFTHFSMDDDNDIHVDAVFKRSGLPYANYAEYIHKLSISCYQAAKEEYEEFKKLIED